VRVCNLNVVAPPYWFDLTLGLNDVRVCNLNVVAPPYWFDLTLGKLCQRIFIIPLFGEVIMEEKNQSTEGGEFVWVSECQKGEGCEIINQFVFVKCLLNAF
jgi:hypothetical protein